MDFGSQSSGWYLASYSLDVRRSRDKGAVCHCHSTARVYTRFLLFAGRLPTDMGDSVMMITECVPSSRYWIGVRRNDQWLRSCGRKLGRGRLRLGSLSGSGGWLLALLAVFAQVDKKLIARCRNMLTILTLEVGCGLYLGEVPPHEKGGFIALNSLLPWYRKSGCRS